MAAYYATPSSSMVAHTSALQPYGQCSELSGPNPNVSVYDLPTDSENEAEVDELESDTDPEDELAASVSANQKRSGRRLGERTPGTTLLPPSKVENIVQPDSMLNKLSFSELALNNFSASITMSKEALFILSVATVRDPFGYFAVHLNVAFSLTGGIHKKNGPSWPPTGGCKASRDRKLLRFG
jgi:hypothetical protein